MTNKILNLFYQKPTIIFLILAFSIYLDTSGLSIIAIEFNKTESFELMPFFIFIAISAVITTVVILFVIRKIVYESKIFPKETLIYFKIVSVSHFNYNSDKCYFRTNIASKYTLFLSFYHRWIYFSFYWSIFWYNSCN